MKKLLFFTLALTLVGVLVLAGCGEPAATTPTPGGTPTATAGQPVPGGTLRMIGGTIPKDLGYGPEKAPSDSFLMLPVLEHLCEWGPNNGELVPVLATSWETSQETKTITWHLRQGVKFHDGEPFNAENLRWNVQFNIDHVSGLGILNIESLEVKDEYTLIMHMKSFDWQTVQNLGLTQPISPKSYLTAGGTVSATDTSEATEEARKAWARENAVGTGGFTVSEWVRDDHITFVKNPNYWQKGKPYLDKIIMTAIADPMVASAKLQAGEADMWSDTGSMNDILQLKALNKFNFIQGPGYFMVVLFSDVDVNSPLHNIKVREAIEYALDRPTMAQTLGQGLFEPFTQMASKTWPGYVPGYDPRPFNTEKAKQLLAEAGYPTGLTMKILMASGGNSNDAMALFTHYLGLAGITVEPDIADLGRYFGALFGRDKGGWDGLCFTASGINPDASDLFVHYGPNPMTFATPNIWKSDAYIQLCNEAIDPQYSSAAEAMPKIKAAVQQAGEDCLFVPMWRSYEASVVWPYVHTEYPKIHGIIWHPENEWMDAH
jgi:peptide/nickel transport system substrate-binding protein